MRRLLSVLLLMTIGFSCCAFAEEDTWVGLSRDTIEAQWGKPVKSLIQLHVWEMDGKTLIAAFSYRDEMESPLLTDYVLLDEERQYISGTIPDEDTLFHVYDVIKSTPAADIPQVIDTGSGFVINTKMTADGYIVRWHGDCPNIVTDMYVQVYDCIEQKDVDGRIIEYLFYSILPKQ